MITDRNKVRKENLSLFCQSTLTLQVFTTQISRVRKASDFKMSFAKTLKGEWFSQTHPVNRHEYENLMCNRQIDKYIFIHVCNVYYHTVSMTMQQFIINSAHKFKKSYEILYWSLSMVSMFTAHWTGRTWDNRFRQHVYKWTQTQLWQHFTLDNSSTCWKPLGIAIYCKN